MELPRNAFKHAIADGRLQIGLWSSLCSNIAAEIVADSGFDWILLDTEHSPNEVPDLAVAAAGAGRRHRVADRAPGLERRGADQARARHRRAVGPRALRAECRGGAARGRGGALSAGRHPRRRRRGAREPLRPGDRLSEEGRCARSASWCRSRRGRRSISSRRSRRSRASTASSSGRPISRPRSGISAIPQHAEVQKALQDAVTRLKAVGKPAGILTTNEEEARRYIGWGYTFVAVGSDVGLLARGADALAKTIQGMIPKSGHRFSDKIMLELRPDPRHVRDRRTPAVTPPPDRSCRRCRSPSAVLDVGLIDRLAGLDHDEADGAAERVAVGAGAHIADRLAVPAYDLGVEQHRLRVLHQHLRQPPRQRAGRFCRSAASRPMKFGLFRSTKNPSPVSKALSVLSMS